MRSVVVGRAGWRREGHHPGPVRHHANTRLGIPVEADRDVLLASAENAGVIYGVLLKLFRRESDRIEERAPLVGAAVQIDLAVAGRKREGAAARTQ